MGVRDAKREGSALNAKVPFVLHGSLGTLANNPKMGEW